MMAFRGFRGLKALLRRHWVHLGALAVLVPIAFFDSYNRIQADIFAGGKPAYRSIDVVVGPWPIQLQEVEPPWQAGASPDTSFRLVPCMACADEIRAISVGIGDTASADAAGVTAEGNPYRLDVSVAGAGTVLWISAEGWEGTSYRTSVPLPVAAPDALHAPR